jgi:hypothetical protein
MSVRMAFSPFDFLSFLESVGSFKEFCPVRKRENPASRIRHIA